MSIDVLAAINQELTRASLPKASGKPTFLFLKEGQKALLRPLYNLNQALVIKKHNKWSENADYRVNAICAGEVNKSCFHCERAKDDKKLSANITFYLPVYVYSVTDTKTGNQITYKEKTEDGKEVEKPVTGIRVLELTSFGTIGAVLKFFNSFYKDDESHTIIGRDFTIEQVGSGQKKSFVCIPKDPKPMSQQMKALIPTPERLRERILEALPPLSGIDDDETEKTSENVEDDDEIPVF